jgi:hypothetical protein
MTAIWKASNTPPGGEWDIRYEVALLGQQTERLTEHYRDKAVNSSAYAPGTPLCMDYNALLEAVLGHARCVIEFLMDGNNANERRAVQFAPGWNPKAAAKTLGTLYGEVCAALSHIAVKRPHPPADWAMIDVADTVLREYEAFLPNVSQGDARMLTEGATIARASIARARTIEASLG